MFRIKTMHYHLQNSVHAGVDGQQRPSSTLAALLYGTASGSSATPYNYTVHGNMLFEKLDILCLKLTEERYYGNHDIVLLVNIAVQQDRHSVILLPEKRDVAFFF